MSLLMICVIIGLFVNTLTANDKYSPPYRGDLQQPFQMQLSKKRKTFSEIVAVFLKFS